MENLRTALKHIRRSPYQAIAAILLLSYTFFIISIVSFHAYAFQLTLGYLERQPQILAFLKSDAENSDVLALQNKLKEDPRVTGEVKYVSNDEAFEILKGVVDNPLITELVPREVLSPSLEFSVTDLSFAKELISELKKNKAIEDVAFTGSVGGESAISSAIERLEGTIRYIRTLGLIFVGFLVPTAILTLIVIIGMRIAARREEIDTLRLIGATPWFIRAPFILEGIVYGVIGAFIGFFSGFLWILYSVPSIREYSHFFGGIPIIPQNLNSTLLLLGSLLSGELLFAVLLGTLGSFIALLRYLRL